MNANRVLRELPFAVRQRFLKTPEQLCVAIEKQILEFDGDPTASPEPRPPIENAAEEGITPEEVESEVVAGEPFLQEEPPSPPPATQRHSVIVTVAWTVVVLTILTALVLRFR
jgi:hypothetical protein